MLRRAPAVFVRCLACAALATLGVPATLGALGVLTACQGGSAASPASARDAAPAADPTAASAGPSPADAWLDAGAFVDVGAPRPAPVELLDAGAAPRRVLGLAARSGERRQRRLRFTVEQTTRIGDGAVTKTGSAELALAVTTYAPGAGGGPWAVELGRLELVTSAEPGLYATLLGSWRPVRAGLEVDAQGRRAPDRRPLMAFRDVEGNELLRLLDDVLDAWIPELPTQAVGPGARWRVTERVVRGGVTLDRVTTYTLGKGARVVLDVHTELVGGKQSATAVTTGAQSLGTEVVLLPYHLERWAVALDATYALDEGALLPDAATATYVLDFEIPRDFEAGEAEESETITGHVELSARLTP